MHLSTLPSQRRLEEVLKNHTKPAMRDPLPDGARDEMELAHSQKAVVSPQKQIFMSRLDAVHQRDLLSLYPGAARATDRNSMQQGCRLQRVGLFIPHFPPRTVRQGKRVGGPWAGAELRQVYL